jgi:hypothetical protein
VAVLRTGLCCWSSVVLPPLEARAHVASLVYDPVALLVASWEMMMAVLVIHRDEPFVSAL